MRKLGRWIWALVPSWWTIGKGVPFAAGLWSIGLVTREMGGGASAVVVGLTLMVHSFLATMAMCWWHDKVKADEERTRRMLEEYEAKAQSPADRIRRLLGPNPPTD